MIHFSAECATASSNLSEHNFAFFSALNDVVVFEHIKNFSEKISSQYNHFVLLGTGGSSVGFTMLHHFFCEKNNKKSAEILSTTDPHRIAQLNKNINYDCTLFIVISKSGTTLETRAHYDFFRKKTDHFVFVGDENSFFHHEAERFKKPFFTIPADLGGRYSVLSAVGILPALLMGYDIESVIEGAKKERDFFLVGEGSAYALANWLTKIMQSPQKNLVLWNYSYAFRGVGEWWKQLVAESLGKNGNGITPIFCNGPDDQHSQLQLFLDGPSDKNFLFLTSSHKGSFGKILTAQIDSVQQVFSAEKIPHHTLDVGTTDGEHLGRFIMLWEIAVALCGKNVGINPFDQPAVEEVKKNAGKIRK